MADNPTLGASQSNDIVDPGRSFTSTTLLEHEVEHLVGYVASHITRDTRPSDMAIIWIEGKEAMVVGLSPSDILVTCAPIFAELHRGGGTIDFATSPVSEEDLIQLQLLIGGKGEKADAGTILATRLAVCVGQWMAEHRIARSVADGFEGDADGAYLLDAGDLHDYLYVALRSVIIASSSPLTSNEVLRDFMKKSRPNHLPPDLIAPAGLAQSLKLKFDSPSSLVPRRTKPDTVRSYVGGKRSTVS